MKQNTNKEEFNSNLPMEENWTLNDSDGVDVKLLLTARYYYFLEHGILPDQVTKKQASWIIKLRRFATDMPPSLAWSIGLRYADAELNKSESKHLDDYLTFAPWRTSLSWQIYVQALEEGKVSPIEKSDLSKWVIEINPAILAAEKNTTTKEEDREERDNLVQAQPSKSNPDVKLGYRRKRRDHINANRSVTDTKKKLGFRRLRRRK